jgi:hypothetical protein
MVKQLIGGAKQISHGIGHHGAKSKRRSPSQ